VSLEYGESIEEDFVWIALDELAKADLLEDRVLYKDTMSLSRRKVLLKYALPAAFLPGVISLIAPKAVNAQSCLGNGQGDCMGNPVLCCPGLTCQTAGMVATPGVCLPMP